MSLKPTPSILTIEKLQVSKLQVSKSQVIRLLSAKLQPIKVH